MARRTIASAVAVVAAVGTVVAYGALPSSGRSLGHSACPTGYQVGPDVRTLGARQVCVRTAHPESMRDLAALTSQQANAATAPNRSVPDGAYRAAVAQRAALVNAGSGGVPNADGRWAPLGTTPLIGDVYPTVAGEGLADLSGRIDSLTYDATHGRLFATIGTGGVWMSTDLARHWRSVGDGLPSQVVGSVGWVPSGGVDSSVGGTIVLAAGEPLNGGYTRTGLGAFWSNNLGDTWHQASGVPDGAMGYQVVADPAHAGIVYVATSMGLFRSTDAGRHFSNVRLPTTAGTTSCAGVTGYNRCQFSNWVTGLVVQKPGGVGNAAGGEVLAAVGYRAGNGVRFTNGQVETTANGLYRSSTGAPGTFTKLAPSGFATNAHIGRTSLGEAVGPQQDHNWVFAVVEDACAFNNGIAILDVPEVPVQTPGTLCSTPPTAVPNNTTINGVYASGDFGQTWVELGNTASIAENPTTQSALAGYAQTAGLYAPGVQAWYNQWIEPDPTKQDLLGAPNRIFFGLEEVWESVVDAANRAATFHVIGPYYSGDTCSFLNLGAPACPLTLTGPADKTTHPDQHGHILIPDKSGGGVSLVVGNDGGAYVQHSNAGQDFSNKRWGRGNQTGLHTLLPYGAEPAKDGTIYFGLQDNGEGKLMPDGKQYEVYGGDAFYSAVDPDNSNKAVEEYTRAVMHYTKDGGKNWSTITPTVSNPQFDNPLVMDPTHAGRMMTAGPEVVQTGDWGSHWTKVYSIGSANQMSAVDLRGNAAYVGFCGVCDIINHWKTGFHVGLATNVSTSKTGSFLGSSNWHNAAMHGLPNRMITWIAIDPSNPKTVYVTLGGYNYRQWVPPASYLDSNSKLGSGHVFVSHDAGNTFADASGNLPDAVANTVAVRGNQLLVGTDVGAFISSDLKGTRWAALGGTGLPAVPVNSIRVNPGADNLLTVATFGRGVYCYQLPVPGKATCANRGANFRPPTASKSNGNLATTGLQVGLPVTAGLMLAAGLLLVVVRRRRNPRRT
jgi:photosystem II stability/assembly factor-like uncharacterized protein